VYDGRADSARASVLGLAGRDLRERSLTERKKRALPRPEAVAILSLRLLSAGHAAATYRAVFRDLVRPPVSMRR
jgi:hypothetical protein